MYGLTGYYLIAGVMLVVGMIVQGRLKAKFRKYGQVPLSNGMTGREIAEQMLRDNNITDVEVISTPGFLSDHYDPSKKTVNLSADVYGSNSVAAAAVAAHECGHAVQHATAYAPLKMRSALVPVVQISTTLSHWVILAGLGVMGFGHGNQWVLLAGIALFAMSTLFSLITLPVEYDASNRALAWLEGRPGMTTREEHTQAADALKWAARTYLVAAISSIATLLYYVLMFTGRSRN